MAQPFNSPTYPYERVIEGANQMRKSERIPMMIIRYLLDLPDASGYQPVDDNDRPRVRLAKWLWYDGPNPLGRPLPTPEQKLSMLYDPDRPAVNTELEHEEHPVGYRIYPLYYWYNSQTMSQTTLKVYIGRVLPTSPFKATIGLTFDILCSNVQENNTRTDAYARSYNIEQCIIEALHGVNMTGVGIIDFSRKAHFDDGSEGIWDDGTNIGRRLTLSIDWMEGGGGVVTA